MKENKKNTAEVETSTSTLREILIDALSSSTVHGIYDIYLAKNIFLKVLFTLLFSASLGYCCYAVIGVLVNYFSYQVVTRIQLVTIAPVEFFAVQFCNLNPYDASKIERISDREDGFDGYLNKTYANYDSLTTMEKSYILSSYIQKTLFQYSNEPNRHDEIYNVGMTIDEMLISCQYQNEICTSDDFIPIYNSQYGMCYRFNQGKYMNGSTSPIRYSGKSGWMYGLQLELYVGDLKSQEKYTDTTGFRFVIFNQTDSFVSCQEAGVDVSTGQETSIGVRRTFRNHMESPYGNCLNSDVSKVDWSKNDVLQFMKEYYIKDNSYDLTYDDETNTTSWNWNVTYTQDVCVKMCLQLQIYTGCGCFDVSLPHSSSKNQLFIDNGCVKDSELNCSSGIEERFFSSQDLLNSCYSKCLIECNEVEYEMHLSQALYPSEWYGLELVNRSYSLFDKHSNSTIDLNYLRNTVAKVNIFYDDLESIRIDEEPVMTVDQLLGSLGGLFGGFLGASFLTLLEPIALLYNILRHSLVHRREAVNFD